MSATGHPAFLGHAAAVALVCAFALAACVPAGPEAGPGPGADANVPAAGSSAVAEAEVDGLHLRLELDSARLKAGETIRPRVTLENRTGEAVTIRRPSSARLFFRVWRKQRGQWRRMLRIPELDLQVLGEMTLQAGGSRLFEPKLPVRADWPISEPAGLSVEVNGREELRAFLEIRVEPAGTK